MKLKFLSVTSCLLLGLLYLSCSKGSQPLGPASASVATVKVPLSSLASHALNGNNNNVADYQLYYVVDQPGGAAPITGTFGPIPSSTVNGYYDFSVNIPSTAYNLISVQVNDAQAQTVLAVGAEGFTYVPGSTLPVTLGPMHQCYAPLTIAAGGAYGFEGNTTASPGANVAETTAGFDIVCNTNGSTGFLIQNALLTGNSVAYMGNGLWVNYLTVPPAAAFFPSSGQAKGQVTAGNSNTPNNYPAAIGDVYCVKILSGGYAWLQVTGVTNGITFQFRPNTTLSYCGYEQTTIDKSGACGNNNNNGTPIPTWVPLGPEGFTLSPATYTSSAFDNLNNPYVAFGDGNNGNKATVVEYVNNIWTTIGAPDFTPGPATYLSLQIYNNVPFLAFSDQNGTGQITVMYCPAGTWVDLGTADFSTGAASYVSLAVNGGVTCVAYSDAGSNGYLEVQKYTGTAWASYGTPSFYPYAATNVSLAVGPSPNYYPYVAFSDGNNSNRAIVYENTGSWVPVGGSPNFSVGAASYIAIGIDSYNSNYPYVVFSDLSNNNRATLCYYSTAWNTVGAAGFTPAPGPATYNTLAFNSQGPFVAFADGNNGNQATAMAYLNSNWVNVGNQDFSGGSATYLSGVWAGNPMTGFIVAYGDGTHSNDLTVQLFQ